MLWTDGLWNDHDLVSTATTGYIVEYDFPQPSFDLNGDGYADIVFQNTVTQQVALWYMYWATLIGGGAVGQVPGNNYIAVGPH